MGTMTVFQNVVLEATECCVCGTTFAVDERMLKNRRETGEGFHCPNGHVLSWSETELDRAKKRLAVAERQRDEWKAREQQRREEAERIERRRIAQVGATTRLRRRMKAGTCPCCQRTFKQLARHMATQHPDFEPTEAEVPADA